MSDSAGLIVEDLCVAFHRGEQEALSGVSLRVRQGQAVGLVGESGSGKSLTARAILSIVPGQAHVSGHISIGGTDMLDLTPAEMRRFRGSKVAMIFQDPMSSLNPVLRVGEAIAQVIRSHESVSRAGARGRAAELMQRVGIRDAAQRARAFPHEFSGGMRQRIMIAMALAARPRILLADEPTTALDVLVQAGILRLLDELRRTEGMGLLFISHDLAVVANICERIAVMYAGQVVEEGPAAAILFRSRMPYTIGLLASSRRDKSQSRLTSIPGNPPPPGRRPHGCRFAPRCPLAADLCRAGPIPLVEVANDHVARCIRADKVPDLTPAHFMARADRMGADV